MGAGEEHFMEAQDSKWEDNLKKNRRWEVSFHQEETHWPVILAHATSSKYYGGREASWSQV